MPPKLSTGRNAHTFVAALGATLTDCGVDRRPYRGAGPWREALPAQKLRSLSLEVLGGKTELLTEHMNNGVDAFHKRDMLEIATVILV